MDNRLQIAYSVYCRSCGAYLGDSGARLRQEPEEWKCSVCFTVTWPNQKHYQRQLLRQGKSLDEREYVRSIQEAPVPFSESFR